MSVEENKRVVSEALAGISNRDVPSIFVNFTDEATWTLTGREDRFAFGGTKNNAAEKEMLSGFLSGFDSFSFEVTSLTGEEDRVFATAVSEGTGPGRRTYKNHYVMAFDLKDGKVWRVREYLDPFEVLDYVEQEA